MPKLSKDELENLNKRAWEAISNWANIIQSPPIYQGINISQLISFFLWDKVSRAIRFNHPSINHQVEKKILETNPFNNIAQLNSELIEPWEGYRSIIRQSIYNSYQRFFTKKVKKIFLPHYNPRIIEKLYLKLKKEKSWNIIGRGYFPSTIKIYRIKKKIVDKRKYKNDSNIILTAIQNGLDEFGIKLISHDLSVLKQQLTILLAQLEMAHLELTHLKPNLVLLYADNHFPYQAYALLAKKLAIPTLTVQHGLDCEHNYLDKTYSSHMATWGINRKNRYLQSSKPNSVFYITGNPDFDKITVSKKINTKGAYILWTTRPHKPEKCYSVSRSPVEGINIFNAFLDFLEHHPNEILFIKPHPSSFVNLYEERIMLSSVKDRIKIVRKDIIPLMKNAKVVVTEDSTAGLEAMFYGKPIINVHFAATPPVIPYVTYKAALQAFNKLELHLALEQTLSGKLDLKELKKNQNKFIKDFAGPMDGKATERVLDLINNILS